MTIGHGYDRLMISLSSFIIAIVLFLQAFNSIGVMEYYGIVVRPIWLWFIFVSIILSLAFFFISILMLVASRQEKFGTFEMKITRKMQSILQNTIFKLVSRRYQKVIVEWLAELRMLLEATTSSQLLLLIFSILGIISWCGAFGQAIQLKESLFIQLLPFPVIMVIIIPILGVFINDSFFPELENEEWFLNYFSFPIKRSRYLLKRMILFYLTSFGVLFFLLMLGFVFGKISLLFFKGYLKADFTDEEFLFITSYVYLIVNGIVVVSIIACTKIVIKRKMVTFLLSILILVVLYGSISYIQDPTTPELVRLILLLFHPLVPLLATSEDLAPLISSYGFGGFITPVTFSVLGFVIVISYTMGFWILTYKYFAREWIPTRQF